MKNYSGWLILGTLLFYLGGLAVSELQIPGAILAWLVVLVRWQDFGRSQKNQAVPLFLIGVAALLFSLSHGIFPGVRQIFMVNLPMLAMFAAVAFLSLTAPVIQETDPATGKQAITTTALSTNLLGSVINLSIIFVFGDRLQRNGRLTKSQSIVLARSFCSAAWWSPFFIATGAALTYAPEMLWHQTVIPGLLMCATALCYTITEVRFFGEGSFQGYPMTRESLTIVATLAVAVLLLHYMIPAAGILNLICFVAPIGALMFIKGASRREALKEFITNRINSVTSQFLLFLAAGVFSTGLTSLTRVYASTFNLSGMSFTPLMFTCISGAMILMGLIGIHPIIAISLVSPLILPLNPDHSQLGFMFLTCWAISTGSSPFQGSDL